MKVILVGASTVVAFALLAGFRGLEHQKYQHDERMWMYVSTRTLDLLLSGDWDSPSWRGMDASWGYVNPPIAKYLMGIGLRIQDVEWTSPETDQPPGSVLAAGRRPSVIFGAMGVLGLLWIGRRTLTDSAAFLAALLLAASPLWLLVSRQAMTDVYGIVLATLAVAAFLPVLVELDGPRRPGVLAAWVSVSGIVSGLGVGAKLNAASTPVALGLVLLMLLARELATPATERARRGSLIVGLGLLFGATSVAGFVALNPYLYDDGWSRFQGILDHWRNYCEKAAQRAHEKGLGQAFFPEERGVRVGLSKLLFPPRLTALLLAIPLVTTIAATRVRPEASPLPRLIGWLVLVPAAATVALGKNQLVHGWLPWIGFLGAGVALLGSSRTERAARMQCAAPLVVVWGLVVAFFVWKMTFFYTSRYYAPVLPAFCLVAGYGLASLRGDLAVTGGRLAQRVFDVAIAAGVLSVVTAAPDYLRVDLKRVFTAAPPATAALHWTCIAGIAGAVAVGLVREVRARPRAGEPT